MRWDAADYRWQIIYRSFCQRRNGTLYCATKYTCREVTYGACYSKLTKRKVY